MRAPARPEGTHAVILTLVPDIRDIPSPRWDALSAQAGLYLSHRWLAARPSKRRVTIRGERRAFAEAGYERRTLLLSECADTTGALAAQLQARHGHPAGPAVVAAILRDQAEGMADSGVVHAAFTGRHMVAFSLAHHHAGTGRLRSTGASGH